MTSEYSCYSGRTSSESVVSASNNSAEFRVRADLASLVVTPRAKNKAHKPASKSNYLALPVRALWNQQLLVPRPKIPRKPYP